MQEYENYYWVAQKKSWVNWKAHAASGRKNSILLKLLILFLFIYKLQDITIKLPTRFIFLMGKQKYLGKLWEKNKQTWVSS